MSPLEIEADRLFSMAVRYRAGGDLALCEVCVGAYGIEPHHLFPRRRHSTRWTLDCAVWVCRACHDTFERSRKI
jgi:hypothetical protein